jgi:hypothetical protein
MKNLKEFNQLLQNDLLTDYDSVKELIDGTSIKSIIAFFIDYPFYYYLDAYVYHTIEIHSDVIIDRLSNIEPIVIKSLTIDKDLDEDKIIKAINSYYRDIFDEYILKHRNEINSITLEVTSNYIKLEYLNPYCDAVQVKRYYLD